jgi:hypothetical protein
MQSFPKFHSHGTYSAHIGLKPLSKTDFNFQFEAAFMTMVFGDSKVTSAISLYLSSASNCFWSTAGAAIREIEATLLTVGRRVG